MAEVLIRLTARLKGPSFVTGTNRIYRIETKAIVSILRDRQHFAVIFIDLQNRFIEWRANPSRPTALYRYLQITE
jgi:hypothetical protein